MVDFLIVCCRFPIGILTILGICLFAIALFILETPGAIVCFPISALIQSRKDLSVTWPRTYPESLRWFFSFNEAEYGTEYHLFGLLSNTVTKKFAGGLRLISNTWKWIWVD